MLFGIMLDLVLLGVMSFVLMGSYLFYSTFKNKQYAIGFKTATFTGVIPSFYFIREDIHSRITENLNSKLHLHETFNTITEEYIKTLFSNANIAVLVIDVFLPLLFVLVLGLIIKKIIKGLKNHGF